MEKETVFYKKYNMVTSLSASAETVDIAHPSPVVTTEGNGKGLSTIQELLHQFRDTKVGKIVWPLKEETLGVTAPVSALEEAVPPPSLVVDAAEAIGGAPVLATVDTAAEEVMGTEEVSSQVKELAWQSAQKFFKKKGGYPSILISGPDRFLDVGYAGGDESAFKQQLLQDIEELEKLFKAEFPDFIIRLSRDITTFHPDFHLPTNGERGIRGRFQISFFTRAKKAEVVEES